MILTGDVVNGYVLWVDAGENFDVMRYSGHWRCSIADTYRVFIRKDEIPKALHMKPGPDAIKVVRLAAAKEWEDLFTIVGEWCEKYNIQIEEDWLTFLVEDIMSFKEVIG